MDTVTGFNNIGAICWFNSLLQAIISCKSLCQILDTGVVETDSTSNTAKELSILIYKLKELDDVQNKSLDILKALITDLRSNKRTIDWLGSVHHLILSAYKLK
jgi:ubiquitin C-terminal hydrolase